ncbi:MAG: response regulator [Bdellovibrionaceae bacterium]|nr:response regulator [Pseudobdellovibrionaceae bacterium]MDW8190895.1 response regulator [Pseudobdellovibrionaceae bacterium]
MKKKLLIIDDEIDNREWIGELASSLGFLVEEASSVDEAVMKTTQHQFDLILCDYRLGRQNGLDFLKYYRKNDPNTPVYMMTGFDEVSEHQVYLLQGNGLFYKPLNPEALNQFLEKHLV